MQDTGLDCPVSSPIFNNRRKQMSKVNKKLLLIILFLFAAISTIAIIDYSDKSKSQTESEDSAASSLKYNKKTLSFLNSQANNTGQFTDNFASNFGLRKQIENMLQLDPGLSKKARQIKIVIIDSEILARGFAKSNIEQNYILRQISLMAPEYHIHNEVQILKK